MNRSNEICKKIRCCHLGDRKCDFDDCIFTTSQITAKEYDIDGEKYGIFIMKVAGVVVMAVIAILCILKGLGCLE